MDTTDKLFSEFEPITREQWKAKAIEDLKGADFDKKLVWKTDDGFPIQPFYTEQDLNENSFLKKHQRFVPGGKREWSNYIQVDVHDLHMANQMATDMVQSGANGILFRIQDPQSIEFSILLNNLDPEKLHISFSTPIPSEAFISNYFRFLEHNAIKPGNIKGFYESDILDEWVTKGTEPDFNALANVIKVSLPAVGFKALVIRSHAFINAGSNTVQELSFTLNKLTDYIDKLSSPDLTQSNVIENIVLHMAIGGDYFFEIAKLRALKIILKSILDVYQSDASIEILSSNSAWSKSFYDPNVNMLRNTTEAMSAIIGGCDALLTYPHDYTNGAPTKFSHRIALNISNLLKEESYFDKVVDPSAGSYYIENLTASLAENTLILFRKVEDAGGFINAFTTGMIQEQISLIKAKKEKEIALRKRVYVGTNKYPSLKEKTPLKEKDIQPASRRDIPLLYPQHAASSFELLRDRTRRHFESTGFIPKVYLACFGNLAARKARASFTAEFFGTAGFHILGEFFFNDTQKAAEESAKSNADIVVICSSDLEYETHGAAFAKQFKTISKDKILTLAGHPEKIVEDLKKSGVDVFIHIRTDAIETLSDFQAKLFQPLTR
ncbi:methylmalonyl-CoA mutase family protein [Chitinophagaceae bacterium LB-8]|uniref:Methylmalonyl-CoA mutase family protein n=1 Tax=Paraflavisolibacter caeni TaxID=2982496 RepID=A0A9X3BK69_9BACT|nr:methylmalonyl-CoA mutase family protein [Paraflavisolibacter caeni]MCU7552338.1 methylmalonyl-CoA mutase family protein [Paraflavisolibacter caeni]